MTSSPSSLSIQITITVTSFLLSFFLPSPLLSAIAVSVTAEAITVDWSLHQLLPLLSMADVTDVVLDFCCCYSDLEWSLLLWSVIAVA